MIIIKKLIVDSSVDFCEEADGIMGEYVRVPFKIIIDDEEIIDQNLDTMELMDKLKKSKSQMKSACPSPNDFLRHFDEKAENFVITISSALSGSYNSALLAREMFLEEYPEGKVYVFDTKSAGPGTSLIALKIKEMINSGVETEEICKKVNKYISNIHTLFILQSLDNMVKNGRINLIKAKIVSLLHIVPVLAGDKNGAIEIKDKARGNKNAFVKLVDLVKDTKLDFSNMDLGITHCNNIQKALELKDVFLNEFGFKKVYIYKAGGLSTVYEDDGGIIVAF